MSPSGRVVFLGTIATLAAEIMIAQAAQWIERASIRNALSIVALGRVGTSITGLDPAKVIQTSSGEAVVPVIVGTGFADFLQR